MQSRGIAKTREREREKEIFFCASAGMQPTRKMQRGEFKARLHRSSRATCRRCRCRGHHHRRHVGSKYTHKSMPSDGQSSLLISLSGTLVVRRGIIYARVALHAKAPDDKSSGIRSENSPRKERDSCVRVLTARFIQRLSSTSHRSSGGS